MCMAFTATVQFSGFYEVYHNTITDGCQSTYNLSLSLLYVWK